LRKPRAVGKGVEGGLVLCSTASIQGWGHKPAPPELRAHENVVEHRELPPKVGVWGLGFGVGVWGMGVRIWVLGFRVYGLLFEVKGLGIGVWGLGFGVFGLGFGFWGLGCGVLRFTV